MSEHAKLSPSAAERWQVCPGSVVLSEGMPSKESPFAAEGTRAHALGESILTGQYEAAQEADKSMLENVMVYVDYVRGLIEEEPDAVLMVEQKVRVNEVVYGTADAVVWIPRTQTLHIIDLKYGQGVAVEATSSQLKIYALAAMLTFDFPAVAVAATIVQPRCPHALGPIRTIVYDTFDLLDFHADIEDAVVQVQAAQKYRHLPEWNDTFLRAEPKACRWCVAAPKCPKLRDIAQDTAKQAFAPGLPYSPEQLADALDKLPLIEAWVKNVREFAYGEAEKGVALPGWKLVEKRPTRKWRDGSAVAKVAALLGAEAYEPASIKTPAAIEKLLPKDQRLILDELCVKESSGHTLVHESDKRPAVRTDARSAFENL